MDTPAASTEKEAAPKPATSPEAPKASPAGDEDDEIVGFGIPADRSLLRFDQLRKHARYLVGETVGSWYSEKNPVLQMSWGCEEGPSLAFHPKILPQKSGSGWSPELDTWKFGIASKSGTLGFASLTVWSTGPPRHGFTSPCPARRSPRSGVREFERAMGCGASAEKKAEEPPATDSSAAPAAASAASPAAEAAESKAEEPKAELTSTTDGKEVPMEQKVQLAAAPQAESSAPANPCTAAPEMLEAMQKLVDATAQEQKGLKAPPQKDQAKPAEAVQEVLKVQNAQMQHRYDHFAADLHRNFGSSIARHVVLTDDLGPAELRKEINEMYLFHGTSPTEAKQIASSDFDFKEEAGHVRTTFGLGLHLPEAAGRAHENSKVEDSLRALLLVKAVGGNVHTAVAESRVYRV
ncbi:unnamed protein product [Durusdinium trenchii]|uniref:Poly [ADP-ribose] polymerase n=1 Tax=Durusdinium trenchii TaxID=1381693 RepID=A0ABP0RWR7_9DINO